MDCDSRRRSSFAVVLSALFIFAQTSAAQTTVPSTASPQRAFLNQYCVTCHNERLRTAGLTLDRMAVDDVAPGAKVWEKVLNKIRTGAMPPPS
jgi:cytochrome c551/c552